MVHAIPPTASVIAALSPLLLPPPLASLREGDALSSPPRQSTLRGFTTRTQSRYEKTYKKHCLFIVLDCFVPRNDASGGRLSFNDRTIALKVKKTLLPFPGSSVRRFAPPKDDGRHRMTGEKKGSFSAALNNLAMGGIKCPLPLKGGKFCE
jgi:hypothetical protein